MLFNTSLKGISPEENVIARAELQLVYFEVAAQYFTH